MYIGIESVVVYNDMFSVLHIYMETIQTYHGHPKTFWTCSFVFSLCLRNKTRILRSSHFSGSFGRVLCLRILEVSFVGVGFGDFGGS